MPELPEVEVVRQGLWPILAGRHIEGIEVIDSRALVTQARKAPVRDIRELIGSTITDVRRRGKYMWLTTRRDGVDAALVIHLGMSGQIRDAEVTAPVHKHERIRILVRDPSNGRQSMVRFIDQRIFGWMVPDALETPGTSHGGADVPSLPAWATGHMQPVLDPGVTEPEAAVITKAVIPNAVTRKAVIPNMVAHIAPDLLDPHIDVNAVATRLRSSARPVKTAILDQGVVSGIGNIYAAEALWHAGVHPRRQASKVSVQRLIAVLSAAAKVMTISLGNGGTSFDKQYVNVNGLAGDFSKLLNVYGRAGEPCLRCGHKLSNIALQGRATVYCPGCQH